MSGLAEGKLTDREPETEVFLNGDDLRNAFLAATRYLERHRDAINALNVFPVPDGDTGINMLLTMRSVNEGASGASDSSSGVVMASMAHGALLGARGNSGVILSQFLHGMAVGLQGKGELDGGDLARAFELGSELAYTAVSKPVDGTMLTVIRALSCGASRAAETDGASRDALSVWKAACEAAREALSLTPTQLPVLREAGVVDAGGQGVVTILEGARHYLAGENVDELGLDLCAPIDLSASCDVPVEGGVRGGSLAAGQPIVQEEYLAATEDELYGYCTQFLIQGDGLDVDGIRGHLSAMAESSVVVGNVSLAKVHVHTHDPGAMISYAVSLGTIGQVNIENIDQQHREFVALHRSRSATAGPLSAAPAASSGTLHSSGGPGGGQGDRALARAVVAVAGGEGFIRLFRQLGCAALVSGGQTMNPSTEELLDAAMSTAAEEVILLPNNSNIVPSALQAAALAEEGDVQQDALTGGNAARVKLRVVPSLTIPQGVAALLAFNPEGTLEANLDSMKKAIATVTTIEVTRAVRPATVGGLAVQEGQYIGLVEGELVVASDSPLLALKESVSKAMSSAVSHTKPVPQEVLTLYWGGDTQEWEAKAAAAQLQESVPKVDVQLVYGGQPFYHYIASLE